VDVVSADVDEVCIKECIVLHLDFE